MKLTRNLAILAFFGAMVSVQCGSSVAKGLFAILGPAGTVAVRVGIAGVLLMAINRPAFWKFSVKEWLGALCYGVSIGALNLSFYYAIERIPLGIAVAIEFIGPLFLTLIFSRKKRDLLWAVLAAVGIWLLLLYKDLDVSSLDMTGVFFAALAGVFWAAYILFGSRITRKMKSTDAVSCGMCFAALLALPFGFSGLYETEWNTQLVMMSFFVAMLSSALPFTLDLIAMKKISPGTFSVMQSLQPATAALVGLAFLGEVLSLSQWIAIGLVMTASAGAALSSK